MAQATDSSTPAAEAGPTAGADAGAHLETRPLYGIGTVARLTGLKPDTLRVWERRYGLGASHKSATGRRQYTQADLEHLPFPDDAAIGNAHRTPYRNGPFGILHEGLYRAQQGIRLENGICIDATEQRCPRYSDAGIQRVRLPAIHLVDHDQTFLVT